jgi:hypothetical protein
VTVPSAGARGSKPPPPTNAAAAGTANTGADGLTVLDPTAVVTCAPGPEVQTTVTPTSVTFVWRSLAGATGYVVADRNGNPLTPSPITQLTYTHNAAHNHSFSYSYSVTALLANGGCVITRLTFTPARPLTPQVTVRVISSTQPGRVALTWGDQADLPEYYLVFGPGLPQGSAQVMASRSGQSYEISALPAGSHSWQVVPYWRAPDEIVGDTTLGARVSATIGSTVGSTVVGSRTITLAGFTAAGGWIAVPPRTIGLAGFTGTGTFVVVAPRTFTLGGWSGTGPSTTVQGVIP